MRSARLWLICAAVAGAPSVVAAAEPAVAAERERIEAERSAAETRFRDRERACASRFITVSCTNDARRERRETLTRLRNEQNRLDEAARKARAEARRAAIEARRATRETPSPTLPRSPARERAARVPVEERSSSAAPAKRELRPPRQTAQALPKPPAKPREDPAIQADRENRERAAFTERQRAAAAHRAEVEARNARREATRKPAASLPTPASSVR